MWGEHSKKGKHSSWQSEFYFQGFKKIFVQWKGRSVAFSLCCTKHSTMSRLLCPVKSELFYLYTPKLQIGLRGLYNLYNIQHFIFSHPWFGLEKLYKNKEKTTTKKHVRNRGRIFLSRCSDMQWMPDLNVNFFSSELLSKEEIDHRKPATTWM